MDELNISVTVIGSALATAGSTKTIREKSVVTMKFSILNKFFSH
ncbi:hypothetical protein SynA1528_00446 [Synechococcus sp. A15-28]|nr:hypothetical protein SynA1528_00446 [Synechococcus sp. A15-28]